MSWRGKVGKLASVLSQSTVITEPKKRYLHVIRSLSHWSVKHAGRPFNLSKKLAIENRKTCCKSTHGHRQAVYKMTCNNAASIVLVCIVNMHAYVSFCYNFLSDYLFFFNFLKHCSGIHCHFTKNYPKLKTKLSIFSFNC